MHVHISRHRNHGYVPADDCLCFALVYLCMMVCMWLLCVCDVCFFFFYTNATLNCILDNCICTVRKPPSDVDYLLDTQGVSAYELYKCDE